VFIGQLDIWGTLGKYEARSWNIPDLCLGSSKSADARLFLIGAEMSKDWTYANTLKTGR
jgi:hypothetical protein